MKFKKQFNIMITVFENTSINRFFLFTSFLILLSTGCSRRNQFEDKLYFYEYNEHLNDSVVFRGYEVDKIEQIDNGSPRVITHYTFKYNNGILFKEVAHRPQTYFTACFRDTCNIVENTLLIKSDGEFRPYIKTHKRTTVKWCTPISYCHISSFVSPEDNFTPRKKYVVDFRYYSSQGFLLGDSSRTYTAYYDTNLILISKDYPCDWGESMEYPYYSLKRVEESKIEDWMLNEMKEYIFQKNLPRHNDEMHFR